MSTLPETAQADDRYRSSGRIDFGDGNGKIVFNHNDPNYIFDLNLPGGISSGSGTSAIDAYAGRTILVRDSSAFTGKTTIFDKAYVQVNGTLGGTVDVNAGGTFEGIGTVGTTTNRGAVSPGRQAGEMTRLTIDGDYVGTGTDSFLYTDAVLGGDGSPSDVLVVNGRTSGTTTLHVTNQGGGGEATVVGILVVDVVNGPSDGVFDLDAHYINPDGKKAVVAGAFGYELNKVGDDWYLQSLMSKGDPPTQPDYQPAVPIYETYPQILLELNRLPTLQQRVGNRFWTSSPPCKHSSKKAIMFEIRAD